MVQSGHATADFLGVRFSQLSTGETVDRIVDKSRRSEGGWLLTPNLSIMRQLEDPGLTWIVDEASEVTLDSGPLAVLAKVQGVDLGPRATGAEILGEVIAALPHGTRILVVGGPASAVHNGAARMTEMGLEVVGAHVPPFGYDASWGGAAREATLVRVTAEPQVVITALGFPRQERMSRELRKRFADAYFLNTGAALAFWTDDLVRAPRWMQRWGLEWLHRLVSEPRRLARRYLVEDLPFACRALAAGLRSRFRRGGW